MASNDAYTFSGKTGAEEPKPKDTDLDHTSPHHTLGKGPLQAASGNHTHSASEVGLPVHTHPADDINSGMFPTDRLGTGVANTDKFLRGDSTWQIPPTGSAVTPASVAPPAVGAASVVGVDTDYAREDHTHAGAALSHSHGYGDLPGDIATDGEVSSAVSTHTSSAPHNALSTANPVGLGTADPGTGITASKTDHVHPTTGLSLTGHTHSYEAPGAVAAHEGAADPHTGYQKESEKDAASGYAGLSAATLIALAQLGTGTPDNTKFLRGDSTWAVPSGGGGGLSQAQVLTRTLGA